jgi:hypothetical protein
MENEWMGNSKKFQMMTKKNREAERGVANRRGNERVSAEKGERRHTY